MLGNCRGQLKGSSDQRIKLKDPVFLQYVMKKKGKTNADLLAHKILVFLHVFDSTVILWESQLQGEWSSTGVATPLLPS